jgi:hypothetical protein
MDGAPSRRRERRAILSLNNLDRKRVQADLHTVVERIAAFVLPTVGAARHADLFVGTRAPARGWMMGDREP